MLLKKSVSKISKAAKFSEGLSWSQQLADKVEPIATHISWSVRNCDENPQKLKESLDTTAITMLTVTIHPDANVIQTMSHPEL
jgi:hypothetical protein